MKLKHHIHHFAANLIKTKLVIVGVPAIIQNSKGEILLGKRSKDMKFYPDTWGLPGGIAEYGETQEQTIKRELKEEMGIETKVIKHGKPFNQLPVKECRFHSLNIPIYCKITSGIPKPKDETSEVKWFPLKEIKNMKLAYQHKEILKQEGLI